MSPEAVKSNTPSVPPVSKIETVISKPASTLEAPTSTSTITNSIQSIDPLAQVTSSSSMSSAVPTPSDALPPWLKNAVEFNPNPAQDSAPIDPLPSVLPAQTSEIPQSINPPEIPDWLKSISTPPVTDTINSPSDAIFTDTENVTTEESSVSEISPTEVPSSELPSWLMNTSDTLTSPDSSQLEAVENIIPSVDVSENTSSPILDPATL